MRDECCSGSAIAGVIIFGCLFLGLTFAIYPGWDTVGNFLNNNILLGKEAPSWVQAVGSIAAIYFTATGTRRQIKSSMDSKRLESFENNRNMARTCFEIAGGVVSVSKSCASFAINGAQIPLERVNDLQETLRILLAKEMPAELIKHVFGLQKILGDYKEKIILMNSKDKGGTSFVVYTHSRYIDVHKNLVNSVLSVRNELKEYMKAIDSKLAR